MRGKVTRVARRFWRHAVVGAPLVLGLMASAHAAIVASERAVLDQIYNQAGGASWTNNTGWNTATDECTWYGITCDGTGLHVQGIALNSNYLVGTLPDLNPLSALQTLAVNDNHLTGTLYPISGLTALIAFNVSNNQLQGALPNPSNLASLQYYLAANNQFTGTLPPSLANNNALLRFYVAGNQLTGAAPLAPSPNSLQASMSALCPNYLTPSTGTANDLVWNAATGYTPWSQACTAAPTAPVANNDSYSGQINHGLAVGAPGVLTNDTPSSGLTVSAWGTPTQGGTLTSTNANGSFQYTPPSSSWYGTDTFTYTASNGTQTATATVSIVIPQGTAPAITSGPLPNGTVGMSYAFTVTANGSPAATFSDNGTLPLGLQLAAATGAITGYPQQAGTFNVQITASNAVQPDATANYSVTIASAAVAGAATPVPTLSEWGLMLLSLLLGAFALRRQDQQDI